MKYFYLLQDGLNDTDVDVFGPFSSVEKAKHDIAMEFDAEPGWVFTIFSQDSSGRIRQVCQATQPLSYLLWRK